MLADVVASQSRPLSRFAIARSVVRKAVWRSCPLQRLECSSSAVVMKPQKAPKIKANVDYEVENALRGRHVSPSLSIYRRQLNWLLSISHRLSSIPISVFIWYWGIGVLLSTQNSEQYLDSFTMGDSALMAVKFMLVLPFAFHSINGARFMIWALAKGLTISQVYTTGYLAMLLSVALTAGLLSLPWPEEPEPEEEIPLVDEKGKKLTEKQREKIRQDRLLLKEQQKTKK